MNSKEVFTEKTKRRERIPYGYILHTGHVMQDYMIDKYNRVQDEINMWIDGNNGNVPLTLLNESHHIINIAIDNVQQ